VAPVALPLDLAERRTVIVAAVEIGLPSIRFHLCYYYQFRSLAAAHR